MKKKTKDGSCVDILLSQLVAEFVEFHPGLVGQKIAYDSVYGWAMQEILQKMWYSFCATEGHGCLRDKIVFLPIDKPREF